MSILKPAVINKTLVCLPCRRGVRRSRLDRANWHICPKCHQPLTELGDVRIPRKDDRRQWKKLEEAARQGIRFGDNWVKYLRHIAGRDYGIAVGHINTVQDVRDLGAIKRTQEAQIDADTRAARKINATGADCSAARRIEKQEHKNNRLRSRLAPTEAQ